MGSVGTLHGQMEIGPQNPPRKWISKDKRKCSEGKGAEFIPDFQIEKLSVFFTRLWTPWGQDLNLFSKRPVVPRTAPGHTGLSLSIFEWAPLKHSMIYSIQKPILKDIDEFLKLRIVWRQWKDFLMLTESNL